MSLLAPTKHSHDPSTGSAEASNVSVIVWRGLGLKEDFGEAWNRAVSRSCFNSPFVTFEWFHAWMKHFAAGEEALVVSVWESDQLRGILPFLREQRRLGPFKFPVLRSMTNPDSGKYGFVLPSETQDDTLKQALQRLRDEVPWAFIEVDHVPESAGFVEALSHVVGRDTGLFGLRSEVQMESPFISLEDNWETFHASRKKKTRRNWRYFESKLREEGDLGLERIDGGPELTEALREAFRIEQLSWKGDQGSAIADSEEESGFYIDLAHGQSSSGSFRLYFLKLNGRRIAFDYCLLKDDHFYVLKTGYDPEYSQFSPGRVLRVLALRSIFEEGCFSVYDFLGARDKWKEEWTDGRAEPLVRIRLYRRSSVPVLAFYVETSLEKLKARLRLHPHLYETVKKPICWCRKCLGRPHQEGENPPSLDD